MSVTSELLCSFELLKPLDSSALKSHIKKGRNKRQNMLNSPVRAKSFFFLSMGTWLIFQTSLRTSIRRATSVWCDSLKRS